MRILVLLHRIPYPLKDGGAWASYDLLKQLSKYVGTVDVLAYNTSKHHVDNRHLQEHFSFIHSFRQLELDNRITVQGAIQNLFTNRSYHISRYETNAWLDQLAGILSTGYDAIILDHVFLKFCIPLIHTRTKAPVFVRVLNLEYKIWEGLARNSSVLKKLYLSIQAKRLKKEELDGYHKAQNLLWINAAEQFQLEEQLGNKSASLRSYYLPFTLDNQFEYSQYKADAICHIASMDWLPNQEALDWFIETVFPLVKNKKIRLHLAGKKLDQNSYKHSGVVNHGEVEDSNLFMKQYGILIVPLLNGAGVRIKILQALALGIPVISTSVGVAGIEAEHQKHIWIADSEQEFAIAIDHLSDGNSRMGLQGKEFFEANYQSKKVYHEFKKYLLNE
jgi:glycosyltransferase involved in cell wall biosynthesis